MTCVNKNGKLIIDSGCSHHMIGDKSKFITLTCYDGNSVRFGNDAPCLIKGKGSIKLTNKISCDNNYYIEGVGTQNCRVNFSHILKILLKWYML